MDLHILLDPVTDFWKCPKKGFFKSDFWRFLNKMLVSHSATRLAAPVTLTPHGVEYGVSHPLTPSSSPVTVLYCIYFWIWSLFQKDKNTKRQKDKKAERQNDKKGKKTKKTKITPTMAGGLKGPQALHRS